MHNRIQINTEILRQNFANIKAKVGESKILAVVKADAYGHGAVGVVKCFEGSEIKPDYYGVASLNEARKIERFTRSPILIGEPLLENQIKRFVRDGSTNIIPTISSEANYEVWKKHITKPVRVHVKINTGMNRLGIRKERAVEFLKQIIADRKFIVEGVYTHLATSDCKDKKFATHQLSTFSRIIRNFPKEDLGIVHVANSGAVLDLPNSYFDMVRPGILLYGYYPSRETSESVRVTPVMTVSSYVSEVGTVKRGEYVGYNNKYKAKTNHHIISIPVGYADGINRRLSNRIRVLINGKLYRQVGMISMDRMSVNVKDEIVPVGAEVILIAPNVNDGVTFWKWADMLLTIPYELMCGLGHRFTREYL